MTEGQRALRKKLLARIHTHLFCKNAKKEDVWVDFLANCYGVKSSADLSIDELMNLLDVLNELDIPKKSTTRENKGKITQKQLYTIEATWKQKARVKTPLALRRFIERTIGYMPLHLHALSQKDATKVITAIRKLEVS